LFQVPIRYVISKENSNIDGKLRLVFFIHFFGKYTVETEEGGF
jgi:hypothetical protein